MRSLERSAERLISELCPSLSSFSVPRFQISLGKLVRELCDTSRHFRLLHTGEGG